MALASVVANHEDELRADLQQYYGIDLDAAIDGQHTAKHIAALTIQLPLDSRISKKANKDNNWALNDVLLAVLINNFRMFVYGMSDPKKRGQKPELIGPSWLTQQKKTLPARVLPINKLMEELNKPRRCNNG